MDFFSHQDRARASTQWLVLLFACAVLTLIVLTSLLVYGVLFYSGASQQTPGGSGMAAGMPGDILFSEVFWKVALGVVAVVLGGSLFRMAQLRVGGRAVAEALKGRLLNLDTRDFQERQVLNVVEEMAIASGIPVPPVYLIEDEAINAFAAGHRPEDAVIGVTRGCIEQLDRDELQGVIAHEFSHIFNGDMRLNLRLIGVLYGIMVLGLIGYFLLRSNAYGPQRNRNRNGSGLVLLGLGLVVVGYGGTFFGNLIKAAVSRQREFLADASAVQFTRNPQGIAGALKKIAGHGSRITRVNTAEYSHMLFEEGRNAAFAGLLATHPPLDARIRRLDPSWKTAAAGAEAEGTEALAVPQSASASRQQPGASSAAAPGAALAPFLAAAPRSAVAAIGNPGERHLSLARAQLERLPEGLRAEAHEPLGASLLVFALLIDARPAQAQTQRDFLRANLGEGQWSLFSRVEEAVRQLPRDLRLPLLELALPSVKQLSSGQRRAFLAQLAQLIGADRSISLYEWCLFQIAQQHLRPPARRPAVQSQESLREEAGVLLAALAAAGHPRDDAAARQALAAAFAALGWEQHSPPTPGFDAASLDAALQRLRGLKALQKPRLIEAMVKSIHADGRVSPEEGELLRAAAALLDCPVPPLLPGQGFLE